MLKPMVFPLDESGMLYVIQDEHGREIGTGSRETCYTLLELFMGAAERVSDAREPLGRAPERARRAPGMRAQVT